jgi:hypothetical protein
MGASLVYLERPNKEIEFEEGENDKLRFAGGSMQGWRINMVSILFHLLVSMLGCFWI